MSSTRTALLSPAGSAALARSPRHDGLERDHDPDLEQIFRDEWASVLANLVRRLGDFDLAEDAAQEAFAIAAQRWRGEGVPGNPRGWLVTTARHRAIDRIRRDRTLAAKVRELEPLGVAPDAGVDVDDVTIPDERLELLFTACHRALPIEAQVALTLRALGGLSTEEIACAFLVPTETMAKRLVRAKARIRKSGERFRVPPPHQLPERLAAVLAVVYLIFNEGYSGRNDLAAESIRLGRVLSELLPDEPEVHGLLALMLINDARRAARFADGTIVRLADQDRSRWDQAELAAGRAALRRALDLGGRGPYVIQAAIADLHAEDPIDWLQIASLYDALARITGSPVVRVNQAVALAELGKIGPALDLLDGLDLEGYPYLHSTRADLLRRLGRDDEAGAAYGRALRLVRSDEERTFLRRRLAETGLTHAVPDTNTTARRGT